MESSENAIEPEEPDFASFGLDQRILKAIAKLGWETPTEIQRRALPIAMQGKDVIAKAKTGSGKTAAYMIPLIEKILKKDSAEDVVAVVILPSKELCKQAYKNALQLTAYCCKQVRSVDAGNNNVETVRPLLAKHPNILITTPSKLLVILRHQLIDLKTSMEILVIDEADVVFSYGYEQDIKAMLAFLPKIHQSILLSATISKDIEQLKAMLLHNPVVLKVNDSFGAGNDQLSHFVINVDTEDKFLILHSLLKLNLMRGKTLIFVNSINNCYRLKLFLEQFSIKSCVINAELPQNSRLHILEEFNRGLYDITIATDEAVMQSTSVSGNSKKLKDSEYSVSRGMDFQDVENVLNFDFPVTVDQYIHRVGRTARGNNSGVALSFVTPTEREIARTVDCKVSGTVGSSETVLKPYLFKMEEIEGFRYRVKDALRAVTKVAVREARLKEIKTQIMNSEKLKAHFEDNPRDLQVLRHDKVLRPAAVKPHLKNIPEYLVPETLKPVLLKSKKRKWNFHHDKGKKGGYSKGKKKKPNDPLKTFSVSKSMKKR